MIARAQRYLARLFAVVSAAAALTFSVLALLVPPEPPPMPSGPSADSAAWFTSIERDYMNRFPPLWRMFGSYSVEQVEFCHEPLVEPTPETFRYASWEEQARECERAAREIRARYVRCAGMLAVLWSLAAVLFVLYARRPGRGLLVGIALSAALTSPIGTEQLLDADYWPDMFALFFPALAAVLLLAILRVVERWPKATPGEASRHAPQGWRAVFAALLFVGGLITIAGGAHEHDDTIVKLGVGFCLSAFTIAVRVFMKLKR